MKLHTYTNFVIENQDHAAIPVEGKAQRKVAEYYTGRYARIALSILATIFKLFTPIVA